MSRRRTVAEPVLCACGCGEFVRRGRTYLVGHHDTPRARQLELGPNSRRRDYTGEREVRMIDCFDSYAGEAMADGFALLGQDGDESRDQMIARLQAELVRLREGGA